MPNLLVHPHEPDADGLILRVTPASAGWRYVGFQVYRLKPGQTLSRDTEGDEACLVLVGGKAAVAGGGLEFGVIGERASPFEGLPWSVYVPARSSWTVTAQTEVELAVCLSPAKGEKPARLIPPEDVGQETRGTGTNARHVRNILPDDSPHAESLLVVEVITPGGNWSSYPPHKHDTDDPPNETYLEETYYHRLARGSGFAFQRVYTDDLSLDETMAVHDRDVVLVPKGYHPVGAPHGFDLWYLNVMAGPVRKWHFTMAPDHAHLKYR
jgi:5-deoxy-glucuronate isomerase